MLATKDVQLAAKLEQNHPDVLRQDVLIAVAKGSRDSQSLRLSTIRQLQSLAREAPLAPEPFAIKGALALAEFRLAEAERLLIEARRRNPRSKGVRYLLASAYLQQQKTMAALREILVLTDIAPQMSDAVIDMLAEFSYTPGAVVELRQALAGKPQIEAGLLSRLAQIPQNAPLVLALASDRHAQNGLLEWQQILLSALVNAGELPAASALWVKFSGKAPRPVGDFSDSESKSPFTWSLADSGEASARSTTAGLNAQYFGRVDVDLASKILTLNPGRYDLQFRVARTSGEVGSLHWTITCLPQKIRVLDLPLSNAKLISAKFAVDAQCKAQQLKLVGLAQVYPAEVHVEVQELQVREGL
jgi:hypothetical protein